MTPLHGLLSALSLATSSVLMSACALHVARFARVVNNVQVSKVVTNSGKLRFDTSPPPKPQPCHKIRDGILGEAEDFKGLCLS